MKKLPIQKIFLVAAFILPVLMAVISVEPALAYKLSVPFPGQPSDINGPSQYIHAIYNFGLGFAILLGVLMIVIGGVRYTISEAVPSKEDAKEQITSAVWGLVLLLVAVLILKTINPQIPDLKEPTIAPIPPAEPAAASVDMPTAEALCFNGQKDPGEECNIPFQTNPPECDYLKTKPSDTTICNQKNCTCELIAPDTSINPLCGNDIKDPGEECDARGKINLPECEFYFPKGTETICTNDCLCRAN